MPQSFGCQDNVRAQATTLEKQKARAKAKDSKSESLEKGLKGEGNGKKQRQRKRDTHENTKRKGVPGGDDSFFDFHTPPKSGPNRIWKPSPMAVKTSKAAAEENRSLRAQAALEELRKDMSNATGFTFPNETDMAGKKLFDWLETLSPPNYSMLEKSKGTSADYHQSI